MDPQLGSPNNRQSALWAPHFGMDPQLGSPNNRLSALRAPHFGIGLSGGGLDVSS